MSEEYVIEINKMLAHCYDVDLLDFIYRLLQKSQEARKFIGVEFTNRLHDL